MDASLRSGHLPWDITLCFVGLEMELLNHLIRPDQHVLWYDNTNLTRRLQVDKNLELRWQLHRQILKGAKPADLAVKLPAKFEVFVNLKTAKQIGIVIPQRVLVQADKVIQ